MAGIFHFIERMKYLFDYCISMIFSFHGLWRAGGEVSDGCGVNLNEALRRAVMRTGQAAPKGGTR
jgi:hypothetical protein